MNTTDIFIIDNSVLREIIEGDNSKHSVDMLRKLADIRAKTSNAKAMTTMACLLNAIYTANKIEKDRLQDILAVIEIVVAMPTREIVKLNFKDAKAVMENVFELAKAINGTR